MTELLKRLTKLKITPHAITRDYLGYGVTRTKWDKTFNRLLHLLKGVTKYGNPQKLTIEDVRWLKEIFKGGGHENLFDDGDVIKNEDTYKLK